MPRKTCDRLSILLAVLVALFGLPVLAGTAQWEGTTHLDASRLYETGQLANVMRASDGKGIILNDHVLFENDGPGAGYSEKGPHTESLHAGVRIRKTFDLCSPAAMAAHVVLYMPAQDADHPAPYHLLLNGHRVEGIPRPWHEGIWHWVPVPIEHLVQDANTVDLVCDAPPGKGYDILFAREDEYERGGGAWSYQGHTALLTSGLLAIPKDPASAGIERITVGATSAKSLDGGKTWLRGKLGPANDVTGEYAIRLAMKRYHEAGTLISAPIDLWAGIEGHEHIVPQCRVTALRLLGEGGTPTGTRLEWAYRVADTKDIQDASWSPFNVLSEDARLDASIGDTTQRYVQVRVRLMTAAPLATPTLRSLSVTRSLEYSAPPPNTFYVRGVENPEIRYASYRFQFESATEPQLAALRQRLGLDEMLADTHGDFERINRLRHAVSQLWYHTLPLPEYPEWNALDILDRNERLGSGGMCMQFTTVFMQALQSIGYHARHVNLFNHEAPEVYVDELGKWVLVDPESLFDSYEFNTETGEPLNALEQHRHFLKRYGFTAANPIPWMSPEPWCNWPRSGVPEKPQALAISTHTGSINHPDPLRRPPQHGLAGFLRIIPRNNFLSQPTPRPLSNGSTFWPWSGYLCWYDDATPRKRQYALHTDREADFYPTLNRVAFTATHTGRPGTIDIRMHTQTPNFEAYEINIDARGWTDSPPNFVWTLRLSALNKLEMRIRNTHGVQGKPSSMSVLWH